MTAGAIADRAGLHALLPVLAAAQAADAPVLIHPGPGLGARPAAARGEPQVDLRDRDTPYDTSSFGPRMVETMARWVGPAQLVYGSDRPVVDPVVTERETELMAGAGALLFPSPMLAGRVTA